MIAIANSFKILNNKSKGEWYNNNKNKQRGLFMSGPYWWLNAKMQCNYVSLALNHRYYVTERGLLWFMYWHVATDDDLVSITAPTPTLRKNMQCSAWHYPMKFIKMWLLPLQNKELSIEQIWRNINEGI